MGWRLGGSDDMILLFGFDFDVLVFIFYAGNIVVQIFICSFC